MNNRQTNNKNMKRVAIAAGATAAALFLAAGLVASRGNDSTRDTAAVPAIEMATEALDVASVDALASLAAEIVDAAPIETAVNGLVQSGVTPKSATKTVKRAKSATSSGSASSDVILDMPTSSETNAVVESTVAPATQQADAPVANTPAEQTGASAQQTATDAATVQSPAPTATGSTTTVSIPKWTYTATSPIAGTDLTATRVTIPSCIPGFNC